MKIIHCADACSAEQLKQLYNRPDCPKEIEEAAMIDGCTPLQTFFRVVFPVLKPTGITVAILNAMWIWNDFLLPYLLLGSTDKTLSVANCTRLLAIYLP